MRTIILALASVLVIGLAFWAYQENYETQTAMKDARSLQRQIGEARERLRILNAEWAYLNRPDRLQQLVNMNFDAVPLLPLERTQFSSPEQVPFPPTEMALAEEPAEGTPEVSQ